MSGRKRLEAFERDNVLVSIIFNHKGKENAIGTKEIVIALNEKGYKERADQIHQIVGKVTLERHLPICSANHIGYWWATSKSDIQTSIDSLQRKIEGLQERIDLLKSFIY